MSQRMQRQRSRPQPRRRPAPARRRAPGNGWQAEQAEQAEVNNPHGLGGMLRHLVDDGPPVADLAKQLHEGFDFSNKEMAKWSGALPWLSFEEVSPETQQLAGMGVLSGIAQVHDGLDMGAEGHPVRGGFEALEGAGNAAVGAAAMSGLAIGGLAAEPPLAAGVAMLDGGVDIVEGMRQRDRGTWATGVGKTLSATAMGAGALLPILGSGLLGASAAAATAGLAPFGAALFAAGAAGYGLMSLLETARG